MKSNHYHVAGLCEAHHTEAFGKHSLEGLGRKKWEPIYGQHQFYEEKTRVAIETQSYLYEQEDYCTIIEQG